MLKLLRLTPILAALVLAVAASSASANAIGLSSNSFRIVWAPMSLEGAGSTISCGITLEGSFHSTSFAKTRGAQVGHIYRAPQPTGCTGGTATLLQGTLPWEVVYQGFTGTLPNIERISFEFLGYSFRLDPSGITPACLARTTTTNSWSGDFIREAGGSITGVRSDEADSIPLSEGFGCEFFVGRWVGTGAFTGPRFSLVREGAPPAILRSRPESVVVEVNEASDRFTVTNDGTGTATATIDSQAVEGVNRERPEIEVRGTGCSTRLVDAASCVYAVTINNRSLARATYRIVYYDGVNAETRTLSIPIEIQPSDDDDPTASPSAVTISGFEQNDGFTLSNEDDGPVTIDRTVVTAADSGTPEFAVSAPGCRGTLNPRESCLYVITVNERPEDDGRVTIYYRDSDDTSEQTLVVDVDIAEDPDPAELSAEPASVTIERLEANDSFVLRNVGAGTATAIIDRTQVVSDDAERPEFSVTGIGCTTIFLDGASCTYIVSVNSRPEADGRFVVEYDDGINAAVRRTTVEVDIAS